MTLKLRPPKPLIAAALSLGLLAVAAPAGAATYTVYSCRGPEGTPVSTRAWQADPGDAGVADSCAKGGALSATLDGRGEAPRQLSGVRFIAPAGTAIAGYQVHLSAMTEKSEVRVQAGLAAGSVLSVPPVTAGCLDAGCVFGDELDPLSDQNLVKGGALPNPALALVAACTAELFGCAGQGDRPLASARLWRSAVDVLDDEPPAIGTASGSLLAPGAVTGRAVVTAPVTDAGGGVADVTLSLDGAEAAHSTPGGACAEPFDVAAPCPAEWPASFEVDTSTLSAGAHAVELRATDAAGQVSSSGPLPFTVAAPASTGGGSGAAGGASGATEPGGAAGTTVVASEPVRVRIDLARTRFTLPATGDNITGTVRRVDGTPAAGATLEVRSRRFGAGDPEERAERTLRTDATGGFSFRVGSTPRRLIVHVDDPAYRAAESREVRILGRLRVRLRPNGRGLRNGSTLKLAARIEGAGTGASRGRIVLVQAVVRSRWVTVDSVEADDQGRAVWRYRFRSTTRPARYRFRLRIPTGAEDWPYPTTTSSAVRVRVKP